MYVFESEKSEGKIRILGNKEKNENSSYRSSDTLDCHDDLIETPKELITKDTAKVQIWVD